MQKQDRRPRQRLGGEGIGVQEPAREGHYAGDRLGPARRDMQRHHRALRKAEQDQPRRGKPLVGKALIEKGVQIIGGARHAGRGLGFRRAVEPGDREPLAPEGIARAGFRRVGGDEDGIRQMGRQGIGKTKQVGAVGAVAVQEHDQRGAPPRTRPAAFEFQLPRHLIPSRDFSIR